MRETAPALMLCILFAACGPQPSESAKPRATAEMAKAVPPRPAATGTLAPDKFAACLYSAGEVSAALGAPYAAGIDDTNPLSAAALKSCKYAGPGHAALVIHVVLLGQDSATIATSKRMMLEFLAGKLTPVAGDADGAIFQEQPYFGTYALHYGRTRYLYEVRLMAFSGAAASAREKLLRLRRL